MVHTQIFTGTKEQFENLKKLLEMGDNDLPTLEEPITDPWYFVVRYFPNYYSSDEIAHNGDLAKLVYDEYEEGDFSHKLLIEEYGGDIDNPQIRNDFFKHTHDILDLSLSRFAKSTQL